MLNFLRKKIGIPEEKFVLEMENVGNTVSSSIPIAFRTIFNQQNSIVMLVGFGVGYSWGSVCLFSE
jgi:3-oxoacyl-[acyl-carrier-protein] synthase-3